jgi:HEAT repeat protein
MLNSLVLAVLLMTQTRGGVVGGIVGGQPAPVSADVAQRREALQTATRNINTAGPEIFTLIETGLASAALSQLIMNISLARPGDKLLPDPRGRQLLQTVLLQSLNDADPLVRGFSPRALVFVSNPLQPEVVRALITAFDGESDESIRTGIVNSLGRAKPESPEVQRMLVRAITDSAVQVRRGAAYPLTLSTPDAGLPLVVAEITSGPIEDRMDFVAVLGSYGARAKPHLNLLESLLDKETRESNKLTIQRAIDAIRVSQ